MADTECLPCRRDEHERCRTYIVLYGADMPCECWVHDHYGLLSEPDEPAPDPDRADREQRRYESRL